MKFSCAIAFLALAMEASAFAPATQQRQSTSLAGTLSKATGQSALDPAVIAKYSSLPFPTDKVLAEYVWVDAEGNTRSKTRTLPQSKVS